MARRPPAKPAPPKTAVGFWGAGSVSPGHAQLFEAHDGPADPAGLSPAGRLLPPHAGLSPRSRDGAASPRAGRLLPPQPPAAASVLGADGLDRPKAEGPGPAPHQAEGGSAAMCCEGAAGQGRFPQSCFRSRQGGGGGGAAWGTGCRPAPDLPIVPLPYAVVQPLAVVVEASDAFVAGTAVLGLWASAGHQRGRLSAARQARPGLEPPAAGDEQAAAASAAGTFPRPCRPRGARVAPGGQARVLPPPATEGL